MFHKSNKRFIKTKQYVYLNQNYDRVIVSYFSYFKLSKKNKTKNLKIQVPFGTLSASKSKGSKWNHRYLTTLFKFEQVIEGEEKMEAKMPNVLKRKEFLEEASALLLCLLFAYTAISKVYDWHGTKGGLYNQVFPDWMATALLYGLPPIELITAVMLVSNPLRKTGFLVSIILLTAFSIYIGIVMTGIFGRIPCSCGGVINNLGWGEHLVFNLVFLGIAVIGYLKDEG